MSDRHTGKRVELGEAATRAVLQQIQTLTGLINTHKEVLKKSAASQFPFSTLPPRDVARPKLKSRSAASSPAKHTSLTWTKKISSAGTRSSLSDSNARLWTRRDGPPTSSASRARTTSSQGRLPPRGVGVSSKGMLKPLTKTSLLSKALAIRAEQLKKTTRKPALRAHVKPLTKLSLLRKVLAIQNKELSNNNHASSSSSSSSSLSLIPTTTTSGENYNRTSDVTSLLASSSSSSTVQTGSHNPQPLSQPINSASHTNESLASMAPTATAVSFLSGTPLRIRPKFRREHTNQDAAVPVT